MNKIFISHSTADRQVAKILADIIKRISLEEIEVWYSNDNAAEGGFLAGDNWYEAIIRNLKESQVVIALLTPNSNNQPWIMYECGVAEALKNCKLIPLKFLINIDEVAAPLQHKQILGLSTPEEIILFFRRLLEVYNIKFDVGAYENIIYKEINEMKSVYRTLHPRANKEDRYISQLNKIDYKIGMIYRLMDADNKADINYEISIKYKSREHREMEEYIKIKNTTTVSDVLDMVYYILDGQVKAYQYMETWILKERGAERYVVISDYQDEIQAFTIFRPMTCWEVVLLDKPYRINNKYNRENHISRVFAEMWKKTD